MQKNRTGIILRKSIRRTKVFLKKAPDSQGRRLPPTQIILKKAKIIEHQQQPHLLLARINKVILIQFGIPNSPPIQIIKKKFGSTGCRPGYGRLLPTFAGPRPYFYKHRPLSVQKGGWSYGPVPYQVFPSFECNPLRED